MLLVDDDDAVRATVRRFLEREGLAVTDVRGGREALAAWDAAGGAVDVLVTDALMPEMDGLALAAALRARRPALPVVVMSGHVDVAASGLTPGLPPASWFVAKPFSGRDLVAAVRAVLAAGAGG